MWDILYPFLLTILTSVVIFVTGQLILEVYIKPYSAYKKLKSKITSYLVLYNNVFHNPIDLADLDSISIDKYKKISNEVRELAAELAGFVEEIPRLRFFIPSKKELSDAASYLVGLSTNLFLPYGEKNVEKHSGNDYYVRNIIALLKLHLLP